MPPAVPPPANQARMDVNVRTSDIPDAPRWLTPMLALVALAGGLAIFFAWQQLTALLQNQDQAHFLHMRDQYALIQEDWRTFDHQVMQALGQPADQAGLPAVHQLGRLLEVRFDLFHRSLGQFAPGNAASLDLELARLEARIEEVEQVLDLPVGADRIRQGSAILQALRAGVNDLGRFVRATPTAPPPQEQMISLIRLLLLSLVALLAALLWTLWLLGRLDAINRLLGRRMASDNLTGVGNRQAFLQHLETELSRVHRYGNVLSAVAIEVQGLADINHRHGSRTGDRMLKTVAAVLAGSIRDTDFLARISGHAFGMLLPSTDAIGAASAIGRLRQRLERHPFSEQGVEIPIQVEFSIAEASSKEQTADTIMALLEGD